MSVVKTNKRPSEIWVMYQNTKNNGKLLIVNNNRIKIISAWRYPGISPTRGKIPIPEDILAELDEILN